MLKSVFGQQAVARLPLRKLGFLVIYTFYGVVNQRRFDLCKKTSKSVMKRGIPHRSSRQMQTTANNTALHL